jgi:hypothetical protein
VNNLTRREKILIEEVKNIQDIIKRMASNSFNLKTWTVTLIIAVILFRSNNEQIFITFIPLISFWYLDSYYLRQEKLFREVYNHTLKYRLNNDDKLFNINPKKFDDAIAPTFKIMFTVSTIPFYGSVFTILIIMSCL